MTNGTRLRALPKAELHLHFEGTARAARWRARQEGRPLPEWESHARAVQAMAGKPLDRLRALLQPIEQPGEDADPEVFEALVGDLVVGKQDEGVRYLEVKFGPQRAFDDWFLERFRRGCERAAAAGADMRVRPLITLNLTRPEVRASLPELLARLEKLAGEGLAGVDLIPEPYDRPPPLRIVAPALERLAVAGLGIAAHAGEVNAATLPAVLDLGLVDRISHGVQAAYDRRLLGRVLESGVTLDICITSNVVLGVVASVREHPVSRLALAGVPFTLGTDNPLLLATDMPRELAAGLEAGLLLGDLRAATLAGADAAFLPPEEGAALRERLALEWDAAVWREATAAGVGGAP